MTARKNINKDRTMKTFSLKGQTFTAFEFDEIEANPKLISDKIIDYPFDGRMIIQNRSGFYIAFNRGEYLTVWKDGVIITGIKEFIDQHAKII